MTVINSITADAARQMAAPSQKEFSLQMEKFFNDLRATAEGGDTELPVPNLLLYPYRVQMTELMKGLGYRVGYHKRSRNQIVVSWAEKEPDGWQDDQILPF